MSSYIDNTERFNASVAGEFLGESWVVRASDHEQLQHRNAELAGELRSHKAAIEGMQAEREQLQARCADAERERDNWRAAAQTHIQNNGRLESEKAQQQEDFNTLYSERNWYHEQLEAAREENAALEAAANMAVERIAWLDDKMGQQERIAEVQRENSALRELLFPRSTASKNQALAVLRDLQPTPRPAESEGKGGKE